MYTCQGGRGGLPPRTHEPTERQPVERPPLPRATKAASNTQADERSRRAVCGGAAWCALLIPLRGTVLLFLQAILLHVHINRTKMIVNSEQGVVYQGLAIALMSLLTFFPPRRCRCAVLALLENDTPHSTPLKPGEYVKLRANTHSIVPYKESALCLTHTLKNWCIL
jgi:hypothetical protein